MHKSNDFLQDLLQSWKKGWPEFVLFPNNDERPITSIAGNCARVAKVSIHDEPGRQRVLTGITAIAKYCRTSKDWRASNLYTIDQCLQTIILEMLAEKRTREEAIDDYNVAERVYMKSKADRTQREKEMEESRLKSLKWAQEQCTEEDERIYEAWKKRMTPGRIIPIDFLQDKDINKAKEA